MWCHRILLVVAILLINFNHVLYGRLVDDYDTLEMVFTVFRHGQKTTESSRTYPKDPFINETYYPFGAAQLTNVGRQTEFELGKRLRARYNDFLGSIYTPNVLKAMSTESNRAKTSLQLVLAGLYPPAKTLLNWENNLNWQPIPYEYINSDQDHLMSVPLFFCPKFAGLFRDYMSSTAGRKIEQKYSDQYEYISKSSGVDVENISDLLFLYLALVSEYEWGLELPQWTRKLFPKYLESAATDFYSASLATPELKQLSGGYLLKQILNDTILKIGNKMNPPNRKLFLYSGHAYNVLYILGAMNLYYPHIPPFGACVMIELHNINGVYGFKIFYEDYSGTKPKILKVPGCDYFCPLRKFIMLVHRNLPRDNDVCNDV